MHTCTHTLIHTHLTPTVPLTQAPSQTASPLTYILSHTLLPSPEASLPQLLHTAPLHTLHASHAPPSQPLPSYTASLTHSIPLNKHPSHPALTVHRHAHTQTPLHAPPHVSTITHSNSYAQPPHSLPSRAASLPQPPHHILSHGPLQTWLPSHTTTPNTDSLTHSLLTNKHTSTQSFLHAVCLYIQPLIQAILTYIFLKSPLTWLPSYSASPLTQPSSQPPCTASPLAFFSEADIFLLSIPT